MTDILQNGTTWLSLSHDITDKNYWISGLIIGSDPKKKGKKKDFTVIVVDSNRVDSNENGWTVIKKKNHGNKNPMLKKNRRNRKITESSNKKSTE